MTTRRCQSCAVPVDAAGFSFGTDADGGLNPDYCFDCYRNGMFTFDITMDEILFFSTPQTIFLPHNASAVTGADEMKELFASLKRWCH